MVDSARGRVALRLESNGFNKLRQDLLVQEVAAHCEWLAHHITTSQGHHIEHELENAQLFQLGPPQSVALLFSRRIGLSAAGEPIDIIGGGRLSGKLGYNIALLNMQTEAAADPRPTQLLRRLTTSPLRASSAKSGDRISAECSSAVSASAIAQKTQATTAHTSQVT